MAAAATVGDTSAWIEWLAQSATGKAPGRQFPEKDRCIVWLELSKWGAREVGEDTTIALMAAELRCEDERANPDAIVCATAPHEGAEGLPGAVVFSKTD